MADAVRARHAVEIEALGDRVGTADLLVDLHAGARADDRHVFVQSLDEAARRLLGAFRNDEHAVAVADLDRHGRTHGFRRAAWQGLAKS